MTVSRLARLVGPAALLLCAVMVRPALGEGKRKSYTRWPLPAAGGSASGDPEIILTFDDGPHERFTAAVLNELKKHDLKAIFFWVGHRVTKKRNYLERRRALVRRAVREGHIVGNHTVNHVHLCLVKERRAIAEIDRSTHIYEELTGLPIVMFRAPYGDHCPRLVRMLAERKMKHLHWDIDPQEWTDNDYKRVAGTLRRKISRLKGRAVVLIHDTKFAGSKAFAITLDWIKKENKRRRARGARPIRFLSGSDLAAEQMDRALVAWIGKVAADTHTRLGFALAGLVP